MYCQNCGTQFEGNFCPNCGSPKPTGQILAQRPDQTNSGSRHDGGNRPITNRWWFWLMILVTIGVLGMFFFQRGEQKQVVETTAEETQAIAPLEEIVPAKPAEESAPSQSSGSLSAGSAVTNQQGTSEAVSFSEVVLLDEGGIKVTATGLTEDEWMGLSINVLIENNSTENVVIQTRYAAVNGAMIYPILSVEVVAGKKANDAISFFQTDLESAGISTIQTVEIVVVALNSETYETLYESVPVTLQTNAAGETQRFDDSGFVALEQEGVRLVVQGITEEDSFFGKEIVVFIENNTGRNITIQLRDVSVNGIMLDPLFSCDVVDGKIAYSTISFMKEDLESNGIGQIDTLECRVLVFDMATWDDIFLSDPITVNFPV